MIGLIKKTNIEYLIIFFLLFLIISLFPDILFCIFIFLNTYSNRVLALVAILGLLFGQSWLNTSKDKMKGKLDFDIARKYLKGVLKLRDTIKIVRSPFISIGEIQNALQKKGFSDDEYDNRDKVNRSVYSLRWEKVQEAQSELEKILLDAEISWGVEAINIQKRLDELIRELRSVIWLFVNHIGEISYKVEDKNFKILYGTNTEDDTFAKDIDKEVEKIKDFLKKHL